MGSHRQTSSFRVSSGLRPLHQNGLYIGLWTQEVSSKDPQPLSREDYHCLLTAGLDQEALAEALVQSLGPKSCTLGPKPDPPSSALPWAVLEGSSFCNIASREAGQHELGLEEKSCMWNGAACFGSDSIIQRDEDFAPAFLPVFGRSRHPKVPQLQLAASPGMPCMFV